MPWCPRCDEVFPEGPACPRCSARLVEQDAGSMPPELQAVSDLPSIKVSRRDRRALERLSGPRAPSSRALLAAVAALVFAVGFLLGRMGTIEPSGPSVRALPRAEPMALEDVEGSTAYLLWSVDPLATVAVHDLYSGDVEPRVRLSPPFDARDVRTHIVALGRSVAVVAAAQDRSYVAFSGSGGPAHGWVPGVEAAWTSPDQLWVREHSGALVEWSAGSERVLARRAGQADRLFQTSTGAMAFYRGRLMPVGEGAQGQEISIPDGAEVIATDGKRALVDRGGLALWDGERSVPVRVQGFEAVGAGFERAGERVAIVLRRGDELSIAVVDERGNAALKPFGARSGICAPAPGWDRAGNWIYLAVGNGGMHAVEASGGRVKHVRTRGVGCGLAWIDVSG